MPEMRQLLRRYRNAVLHFQSPITTPKFLEFLQKGEAHEFWVHALHYEFVRFLRDYLSGLSASDEDAQEFRQMIEGVIHWYPYRHHRDLDKAEQLARTVRELLKNSGDDSEQRQSLVSAWEEAEKVVEQSDFGRLRGEFLRRAGIE
jgi:erythromycin esterase-like protein